MTPPDSKVKPSEAILAFIDRHPRIGWYLAFWMFLMTVELLCKFIEVLLRI
jgi:hypothetical protein